MRKLSAPSESQLSAATVIRSGDLTGRNQPTGDIAEVKVLIAAVAAGQSLATAFRSRPDAEVRRLSIAVPGKAAQLRKLPDTHSCFSAKAVCWRRLIRRY